MTWQLGHVTNPIAASVVPERSINSSGISHLPIIRRDKVQGQPLVPAEFLAPDSVSVTSWLECWNGKATQSKCGGYRLFFTVGFLTGAPVAPPQQEN